MFPASISILCVFDFSSILSRVAPQPTPLFLHYSPITIHRQRYSFHPGCVFRPENLQSKGEISKRALPHRFDFPGRALLVCLFVQLFAICCRSLKNAETRTGLKNVYYFTAPQPLKYGILTFRVRCFSSLPQIRVLKPCLYTPVPTDVNFPIRACLCI